MPTFKQEREEVLKAVDTICTYCVRPADFEGTGEPCEHCYVQKTYDWYRNAIKPYTVTLTRTIQVQVQARSKEQAKTIGEVLATGVSDLACEIVNNAMCNGDDDLVSVRKAVSNDGFWHARLTEEECEQILNEGN